MPSGGRDTSFIFTECNSQHAASAEALTQLAAHSRAVQPQIVHSVRCPTWHRQPNALRANDKWPNGICNTDLVIGVRLKRSGRICSLFELVSSRAPLLSLFSGCERLRDASPSSGGLNFVAERREWSGRGRKEKTTSM